MHLYASINKHITAQSAVFTSTYAAELTINNITTAAASFAGNMPAASAWPGKRIKCIKVDTGAGICTVTPNGAETFQGASAFPLRNYGDFIELESDGTNIWVIASLATLDSAALAVSQIQTLAHGIGIQPRINIVSLLCSSSDVSFVAGEEVSDLPNYRESGGPDRRWNITKNATNILTVTDNDPIVLLRNDTGAGAAITMANWKFRNRYSI